MDRNADKAIIIRERGDEMGIGGELEEYLERLAGVLGHADRRVGLMDYCRGLMLPIKRKSIEPLAAHVYRRLRIPAASTPHAGQ